MNLSLALALFLLPASPGRADDSAPVPAPPASAADTAKPSAELLKLDRLLAEKQKDRDKGRLAPDEYRRFAAKFRANLDETAARVPPTVPNRGLHATLLARLGDSVQALKNLDRALADDPKNPALITTKGCLLLDRNDYAGAAAAAKAALQADPNSLGAQWLKHAAEGRVPTVKLPGSPWSGAASEAAAGAVAGSAARTDDPSLPFKPEIKGLDKRIDVPDVAPPGAATPTGQKPLPLWPMTLPLGAGLVGYGLYRGKQTYVSAEGLNPDPQVALDNATRNWRASAAVVGALFVGLATWEYGPGALAATRAFLAAAGPSAPALTPALAGAGAGGGAAALDPAIVAAGAKTSALIGLVGGAKVVSDHYSYAKSNADDPSNPKTGSGKPNVPSDQELADSANTPDSNDKGGRLTRAGRSLAKHNDYSRVGSRLPQPKGNPETINNAARQLVDSILNDPDRTVNIRNSERFGKIIEIRRPDGVGVRFGPGNEFLHFIE